MFELERVHVELAGQELGGRNDEGEGYAYSAGHGKVERQFSTNRWQASVLTFPPTRLTSYAGWCRSERWVRVSSSRPSELLIPTARSVKTTSRCCGPRARKQASKPWRGLACICT